MAIRNIVKDGDPILKKVCRKVEVFDEKLGELIDDMIETMREANGAGLAAPQVGVLKQICVVEADTEKPPVELINPEIIAKDEEQFGMEGCLSFPGQYGLVRRPRIVSVKAQDRHGEFFEVTGEDLEARAFMHETDHLQGATFKELAERMLTPEELESGDIPELRADDESDKEE